MTVLTEQVGCPGAAVDRPWAVPHAYLVLPASADRTAWLAARRHGVGASDASAVLGLSPWSSPYEKWMEKRGLLPEQPDNDAMRWGRLLEAVIADEWSAQTGIAIRRAGLLAAADRPWQLATVDRLAACGGLVEVKTLSWRAAGEWADGQTPDHAEAQSQHQMAVTGRGHVHVVGLQDGRTWLERTVVRDDTLIADLTAIEADFWQSVVDGVEPPVDGAPSTTAVLAARWPALVEKRVELGVDLERLLHDRDVAIAERDAAAAQVEQLDNRIKALLGEATVGTVDDVERVTWRRDGTLSVKRLAAEHPDAWTDCQVPATGTVLDTDRLKAEWPEAYTAARARVLRPKRAAV